MKIDTDEFRITTGTRVRLAEMPTRIDPVCKSKHAYKKLLKHHIERLADLQRMHYASNRHAILMIFQAMDAAGKDGAIRHVMSGINPQGCRVSSFKQPSSAELQHDFLWRATCELPERGRIGIFNRSYYEEVLVVRVHPELLAAEAGAEPSAADPPGEAFWQARYRSITDLEWHLHANGTRTVKIFLHLSKEEQRKRFLERIDEAEKNWKFSVSDIAERKLWSQYQNAYEQCLGATSTLHAPWYAVPADDKENARLIVSQILLDTFDGLAVHYPKTSATRKAELKAIRKTLKK